MKRKKIISVVIAFIIFSLIVTVAYINDKRIYSEIHDLINIDQIDNISSTYIENDKVVVEIEPSDNATYIEVDKVGYVVDNQELFGILSKYKCKKSKNDYFPYGDVIVAKISLTQNQRPRHFLLGDFNIWYESGDQKVFDIIDGDKLLQEILLLVEKNIEITGSNKQSEISKISDIYGEYIFEKVSYLSLYSSSTIDYRNEQMTGTEYTIKEDFFIIKSSDNTMKIESPIYIKEEVPADTDVYTYMGDESKYQYTVYDSGKNKTYWRIYSSLDCLWIASYVDNTANKVEIIMEMDQMRDLSK